MRRRALLAASAASGGDNIDVYNYLTIEALEDGLNASLSSTLSTDECQYCIDGDGNWRTLPADTTTQSINQGQTLSFRGNLTPNTLDGIGTFTINKKCNLEGNCMSLLFGDDAMNNYSLSGKKYAFYKLFYNCTSIVQVSKTFLPATTLADFCYNDMFYGCSSLVTAPELPATSLASYCYCSMFNDCKKLNYIKMLATNISASSCLSSWVSGVASSGTFVKNKKASWSVTGVNGIPSGWTVKTA